MTALGVYTIYTDNKFYYTKYMINNHELCVDAINFDKLTLIYSVTFISAL